MLLGEGAPRPALLSSTSKIVLSLLANTLAAGLVDGAQAACVGGQTGATTTINCTGTTTVPTTTTISSAGNLAVTLGDTAPTFVTVSSGSLVSATLTGPQGTFGSLDTGSSTSPSSLSTTGDAVAVSATNGASILVGQNSTTGAGVAGLNANITSQGGNGINAIAAAGGAISLLTAPGTTITGAYSGITASVVNGAATINFNGNVATTTPASYFDVNVRSSGTGAITIGGSGAATSGGIFAASSGTGAITINGTGSTTDLQASSGILALIQNTASTANITITRSGFINGATDAITATNSGSGNILVTTAGAVTGNGGYGINTSVAGGTATINVGAGSTVSGSTGALSLASGSGSSVLNNAGTISGAIFTSGSTTINNSGVLLTTGAINAGINNASGSVFAPVGFSMTGAPTSSPSTISVSGPVTFQSGSTFGVLATPTQASLLAVNGPTTIGGGTVFVSATNDTIAPNTTYRILSSTGGVSGTFTGASANYAYLSPTLSYDNNDAYVTLASNGNSLQSVMTTPNTISVASAINTAPNSQLFRAFQQLTPGQAQAAANSISGEGNTQVQTAGAAATRNFVNFISDRASPGGAGGQGAVEVASPGGAPAGVRGYTAFQADASPIVVDRPKIPPGFRVFATGFGGTTSLQGQNPGVAGQNANYYGGLIGLDYKVTPDLLIGGAIGASDTDFSVASRASSGSVTGFNGNLFSIATFGLFYAQSLTTISDFANSTTRNVAGFGGLASATEKANFNSFEIRERLEAGRVVDLSKATRIKGFKVTPFVAMEIAELTTSGFSENNVGGGPNVFGLTEAGHTYDDARTFVGARLEASTTIGNGMMLRPIVRLAYVHSFTTAPASMNQFQSIPGATFAVAGANVAHNAAEIKAGAELELAKNTVVYGNFESELGNTEQIYGGRAGIRVNF